jgi:hypothetical protein
MTFEARQGELGAAAFRPYISQAKSPAGMNMKLA